MIEAAAVPPFRQWNTVVDWASVRITKSVGRNTIEVVVVSLVADSMVPLITPRLNWSSERGRVAFLNGETIPSSTARNYEMGRAAFFSARLLACFQ